MPTPYPPLPAERADDDLNFSDLLFGDAEGAPTNHQGIPPQGRRPEPRGHEEELDCLEALSQDELDAEDASFIEDDEGGEHTIMVSMADLAALDAPRPEASTLGLGAPLSGYRTEALPEAPSAPPLHPRPPLGRVAPRARVASADDDDLSEMQTLVDARRPPGPGAQALHPAGLQASGAPPSPSPRRSRAVEVRETSPTAPGGEIRRVIPPGPGRSAPRLLRPASLSAHEARPGAHTPPPTAPATDPEPTPVAPPRFAGVIAPPAGVRALPFVLFAALAAGLWLLMGG